MQPSIRGRVKRYTRPSVRTSGWQSVPCLWFLYVSFTQYWNAVKSLFCGEVTPGTHEWWSKLRIKYRSSRSLGTKMQTFVEHVLVKKMDRFSLHQTKAKMIADAFYIHRGVRVASENVWFFSIFLCFCKSFFLLMAQKRRATFQFILANR